MSPHAGGAAPARLTGLDAARALAILGMLAVNIGPLGAPGAAGTVLNLAHGRASLLFVLLAGIGYSFLTRRALQGAPVPWQQVLWRSVVLLLIGLSTQLLPHGTDVILTTYAALFLLALLFVRCPSWVLLACTGVIVLAGPLIWLAAQFGGSEFDHEPVTLLESPGQIVASTFLTGPYPVITWLAPFLFGMWLGRCRLRSRGVHVRLVIIGAGAALIAELGARALQAGLGEPGDDPGLDWLMFSAGHTQMPLWLVAGTGAAVFVVGLALLVEPHLGRLARPLVATGQLALTAYVAHLIIVAAFVRPGPYTAAGGVLATVVVAVVLMGSAMIWRHFFTIGPLEALLRLRLPRLRRQNRSGTT